jgi:hypothetical protein
MMPEELKPYTSAELMNMAVNGIPIDPLRVLATYADPENWGAVYGTKRHWTWQGPVIVGYELAQHGLRAVPKPLEEDVSELAEQYVWVVGDCWKHEGYTILGIFDSEEAAKTFKSLEETEEEYPLASRDSHWVQIEKFKLYRRRAQ